MSNEPNGHAGATRLSHSLPGSPADRRPNSFEVIGSAESLVGRVSDIRGLRSTVTYCERRSDSSSHVILRIPLFEWDRLFIFGYNIYTCIG